MAKGKKTGGRPFAKGNPYGRPPMKPEDKVFAKLTRTELTVVLSRLIRFSEIEIKEIMQRPDTSAMEKMIGAIILQAIKRGDPIRLAFLIEQICGKMKEPEREVTFNFMSLPKEKVIEISREAIRYLEEHKDEP